MPWTVRLQIARLPYLVASGRPVAEKDTPIGPEKTYLRWIVRYVKYHDTEHPRTFGKPEVREYLSYLATDRNVAASTQNQALNALLFLYRGCARGRVGTGLTYKITVKKSSHIVVVPARLFASPLDAGVCL